MYMRRPVYGDVDSFLHARTGLRSQRVVCAWLVVFLLATAAPAWSQADVEHQLNIPQAPLKLALDMLAFQTGAQIGSFDRRGLDVMTGPLKGRYTVEQALHELLRTTPCRYQRINDRTYLITAEPAADLQADTLDEVIVTAQRIQAGILLRHRIGVDFDPGTIIVVGSRVERSTSAVAAPGLDREAIDRMGASTIADLLKYIPQQPYTRPAGFQTGGQQYVELRGLGVDTAVVLLNGRRVMHTVGGVGSAFDLNTIPMAAVERVETIRDVSFNVPAIGGGINIVLKKNISRPKVEIEYGTAAGGAAQRLVSASAGYSNERAQCAVVLDYFDRSFLQGSRRSLSNDQDFRRFGGSDWRTPASSPGNITSLTFLDLPGLPSRFAAVPIGSTGIGLTPADFLATAGQRNLDSPNRYVSIVPAATRLSAVALGEISFESLTVFGEFLYADRDTTFRRGPPTVTAVVPVSNAYTPFNVPVVADVLLEGMAPRLTETEATLLRVVVGLQGGVGSWNWQLSLLNSDETGVARTKNELSIAHLNWALASPDPASALNVFRDGPGGSPELLASLVDEPTIANFSSGGAQVAGELNGRLLELSIGEVWAALGAEWRQETTSLSDQSPYRLRRTAAAEFVDLRFRSTNAALQLTVSGRFDQYSDFAATFNPLFAIGWSPFKQVDLHASYGTSFRPPALYELSGPRTSVVTPVVDRRRANEIAVVSLLAGANPDLEPVTGESWTAGVRIRPHGIPSLDISLDYWHIRDADRIALISPLLILENELRFPDRVVRAAPTPSDVAAGRPGALKALDVSRMNLGHVETSGIDLRIAHDFATRYGQFATNLAATWVDEFAAVEIPGASAVDRAGVANPLGTVPEWRIIASFGWRRGPLSLAMSARHAPAYDDVAISERTGRKVAAQTLVDMDMSLHLGAAVESAMWRDTRITMGVTNLFDQTPPFAEVGLTAGYDLSQGDLRQRYGYIRISREF